MGGGIDPAERIARRADTATLAGKGKQEVVAAAVTEVAGETVGENAGFEVTAAFTLDVGRGQMA